MGYFSAFDIDYFSLFSLSEHIVFALQALPAAIGLTMIAYVMLVVPWGFSIKVTHPQFRWVLLSLLLVGFGALWLQLAAFGIIILAVFAALLLALLLQRPVGSIAMVLLVPSALLTSWGFGHDWGSDKRFRPAHTHVVKTPTGDVEGTLIRAGERGLLFFFATTNPVGVVRWDSVQQITTKEKKPRHVPWIRRRPPL